MFLQIKIIPLVVLSLVMLAIIILGIHFVPKNKVYIIERLGVYYTTWHPGIHFLLFGIEKVREKVPTNDQIIDKNFEIHLDNNNPLNFMVNINYKIKEPVNYAYRKNIVMENLDEIIIDFLNLNVIDMNKNLDNFDFFNNELLNITKNHADLIDLNINSVSIKLN